MAPFICHSFKQEGHYGKLVTGLNMDTRSSWIRVGRPGYVNHVTETKLVGGYLAQWHLSMALTDTLTTVAEGRRRQLRPLSCLSRPNVNSKPRRRLCPPRGQLPGRRRPPPVQGDREGFQTKPVKGPTGPKGTPWGPGPLEPT
jgi:hypothetical protein